MAAIFYLPRLFCLSNKFTFLRRYFVRRSILVAFPVFMTLFAIGQKFPASVIPDSLKQNASMVIRLDEISYEIRSNNDVISREHHVYTILNEKGEYYATYKTRYNNKTVQINSVTGYLYDASGKEIMHFKKKDMQDQPLNDGSSFVNDERLKVGSLYSHTYPYTVDFEEEDQITELFQISGWQPQGNFNHSVQKSTYSITAPSDYALRYRMLNSSLGPVIEEKGKNKSYTWKIQNLVAYEEEPFSNILNCTPHLLIGLGDVEMEGFRGNMSTWNNYAKFYGSLQKGRDILPDEIKHKVHELTDGLSDTQAKVAALYNYLQQNSHYVGIQLGIGGWQTFDAIYVATKKYGDCKALSNFMVSLLKEAGIKSNAVVIKGGQERMDFISDFTYDPFNHIICCVPLKKDTIWLECTSQSLPPGYLGEFTSNRYGLLIDEDGGSLVHTPSYLMADNVQIRKVKGELDSEGNLNLQSRTQYRALCQDEVESIIHHESKEEQLNRLKTEFNLPTYDVVSFNYQEDHSKRLPVIIETLELKVSNYAQISGKRIFIKPDILTRSSEKLAEDKDRRLNIELDDEYRDIDSADITIPAGYTLESSPRDIILESKFGKYQLKTVLKGNSIVFTRLREQFNIRFPPKEYAEVVKYYNDIYESDHASIVLVKHE